ncbi:MAG: hypothetical protein ABFS17_05305 [Chloroflexota bacterium]
MKIDKMDAADWVRAGDGQFTQIDPKVVDFKGKLTKYTPQNMDISILLRDELNCTILFFGKRVNAGYQAGEDKLVITIPNGPLKGSVEIYKRGSGTEINLLVFGGYPLFIHPAGV